MSIWKVIRDLDHGITPKKRAQMDAEEAEKKRRMEENARQSEEHRRKMQQDRERIFQSPVSKRILDEVIAFLSVTDVSNLPANVKITEKGKIPFEIMSLHHLSVCTRGDCVLISEWGFCRTENDCEYRFVFEENGYTDITLQMAEALCDYLRINLINRFDQRYEFTKVQYDRMYRPGYLSPSTDNPHYRFEISYKEPVAEKKPLAEW